MEVYHSLDANKSYSIFSLFVHFGAIFSEHPVLCTPTEPLLQANCASLTMFHCCAVVKPGVQRNASVLSKAGWDFRTAIDRTMPVKESFVCTKHSVGHSTQVTAAKVQNKRCKCNNNKNNNDKEAANQRAHNGPLQKACSLTLHQAGLYVPNSVWQVLKAKHEVITTSFIRCHWPPTKLSIIHRTVPVQCLLPGMAVFRYVV